MAKELQLRLSPEEASDEQYYLPIVAKKLGLDRKSISSIRILRRSVDARKKQIWINVLVRVAIGDERIHEVSSNYEYPDVSKCKQVVIVGAGPAGLFAALRCIELGLRPVIIERGKKIADRKIDIASINRLHLVDPESNYGFGEGGAGTFSDGKLYTRSIKRGNVKKILHVLHQHGANEDILIDAHPHIGTDKLTSIITAIRHTIERSGGEVHFRSKVTGLNIENKKVIGVNTHDGRTYDGPVILATGHSARDVYSFLWNEGVDLEQKTFAMGVRVEHPQSLIDSLQYHGAEGRGAFLPAATYSLVTQVEGRGVYSFCMCPGGFIVPAATAKGEIVVNGMSASRRDSPYANSGIVVEIQGEDLPEEFQGHVLGGMYYQQWLEQKTAEMSGNGLIAPALRLYDFVNGRLSGSLPSTSYIPGIKVSPIFNWMPKHIGERLQKGFKDFGRKMPGFLTNDAIIVGTESRTSSPVRIPRDKVTCQHISYQGLFPCGEGAGYAGGIASSAMDGERCAEAVAQLIESPFHVK